MTVHLVTDRRRLCPDGDWDHARRCLLQQAENAVAAGVDVIQIRERDLEARDLSALVTDIVGLAGRHGTRVVVNDRLDVAIAAGADGVHLRADSISPSDARRIAPPGFLIGCSVHTVAEAIAAASADYQVAGTVWSSASKPESHALLGPGGLAEIARAVSVPVLAIGGVTVPRMRAVADAGASGVAAIGLFVDLEPIDGECRAPRLAQIVAAMREQFDTSRSHS